MEDVLVKHTISKVAEKDAVLEILMAECEVRPGRPQNF
jgi:hypothetical protein